MSGPNNVTLISYLALYIYHASSHNGTWELAHTCTMYPNDSKYTAATCTHYTASQRVTITTTTSSAIGSKDAMASCQIVVSNDENR